MKADPEGIKQASAIILKGGVIAFPTETFYGLGAEAFNEQALRRIFEIKGRDEGKPLLLLLAEKSWVAPLVKRIPLLAQKLMDNFWPGPLTLVFAARPHLSPLLTGNTGKVGLRISSNSLTQKLVQTVGKPITGTSANLSGEPSLSTAQEVVETLGNKVEAILDGGKTAGGLGSTVLDISGPSPQIIREGAIPLTALAPFLIR
ncbi:MAG: L-threonylcarbamoyladenylate synthase [Thermodesulfobacteriota bacterium]